MVSQNGGPSRLLQEPTETSQLLQAAAGSYNPQNGQHELPSAQQQQDSEWTKDAIYTASLAAIFLVLFAFADTTKYIATVRLVELGVCREHYLTHGGYDADLDYIPEHLCKSTGIQQRLAHLRGYLASLDALVGLLLTLPYGMLVDRLGERLVGGINVLGYLLSCAWLVVVCFYWHVFPIWSVVLAPLFRVVGGGSPVLTSVVYSIVAKRVPSTTRSLCFFLLMGAQLITEIVTIMTTASLLDHELLFTPLLLNFPLGLLCIVTLIMMRPGTSLTPSSSQETEPDQEESSLYASLKRSTCIVSQHLSNRNVLILLLTVPVAKLVNPITELMLQYIPKKFDTSLASASRLLSIQAFESLALLVVILPAVKNVAQVKFNFMPTMIDLYITQSGFLVMSMGCLIMAFSQNLITFIIGFSTLTLGCSTRPALQSLLTDLVDREHIAILYTMVALGDGIGSAAGAFLFNRALALTLGWDDAFYLGLPFVIGAAFYFLGFIGSIFAVHDAGPLKLRT